MPVIIYIESYLYHPQTKETKYYTITQKTVMTMTTIRKKKLKKKMGGMALFIDLPRPLFEKKNYMSMYLKTYLHLPIC